MSLYSEYSKKSFLTEYNKILNNTIEDALKLSHNPLITDFLLELRRKSQEVKNNFDKQTVMNYTHHTEPTLLIQSEDCVFTRMLKYTTDRQLFVFGALGKLSTKIKGSELEKFILKSKKELLKPI